MAECCTRSPGTATVGRKTVSFLNDVEVREYVIDKPDIGSMEVEEEAAPALDRSRQVLSETEAQMDCNHRAHVLWLNGVL